MFLTPITNKPDRISAGIRYILALEDEFVNEIIFNEDGDVQTISLKQTLGAFFVKYEPEENSARFREDKTTVGNYPKITQRITWSQPGVQSPQRNGLMTLNLVDKVLALVVTQTDEVYVAGLNIYPNRGNYWEKAGLRARNGSGQRGQANTDFYGYTESLEAVVNHYAPKFVGDITSLPVIETPIIPADTSAPYLLDTLPVDNASEVSNNTRLIAYFNEPIQRGTGTVFLREYATGNAVAQWDIATDLNVVVSPIDNSIEFILAPTLSGPTRFYMDIPSTAIRDVAGNYYAGTVDRDTWDFTTLDEIFLTPIQLLTVSPPDDESLVSPTTALLRATFDREINPAGGLIELIRSSDQVRVFSEDVNNPAITFNGAVLDIDITGLLVLGDTYYVNIEPGAIVDLQLNQYGGIQDATTWNFTVSNSIDDTRIAYSPVPFSYDNSITPGVIEIDFDGNTLAEIGTAGNIRIYIQDTSNPPPDYSQSPDLYPTGNDQLVATIPFNSPLISTTGPRVSVDISGESWYPLSSGAFYRIEVDADMIIVDGQNWPGEPFNWFFHTAVNVTLSLLPADDSVNVATDFVPSIGLSVSSRAGNITNISNGTYYITMRKNVGGSWIPVKTWGIVEGAVDPNLEFSNGRLSLLDAPNFYEAGVEFSIIFDNGVMFDNITGDTFSVSADTGWTFVIDGDTSGPTLLSSVPVDGANGYTSTGPFRFSLNFNESVKKGSTTAKFKVYEYDTDALVIESNDIQINPDLQTEAALLILVSGVFQPSTRYYILVDNGLIQDLASNDWPGINNKDDLDFFTEGGAFNSSFNQSFDIS